MTGEGPRRRMAAALVAVSVTAASIGFAWAAELLHVAQKGRQFDRARITIARGDTIEFSNDDEFLHHIYVDSPDFRFDSPEQPPRTVIDLPFTVRGTFEVRCRIHPKMMLAVTVE
jgi:plastocyanin